MQAEEYAQRGKELVDYIKDYLTKIRERRVNPDVQPGYMRSLLPSSAPLDPENWDSIFRDVEKIIMPGVVHWQSPHMHAYFPALTSWPSLLGDMLADAINCLGFTWASSPACTELEIIVMDWLCKALGLPSHFLHQHPESRGGGILQSTVSECTLVALLAARKDKILQLKETDTETDDSVLNSRLIAYASDQAHSSVEKAGLISLIKIRFLPTDENFSLRGETLQTAIEEDKKMGLVPIMLCATLGTTGVCSFDSLAELGPVCAQEGMWLHVDAAYAGSAFLCPELRGFMDGIEFADSFVFNPSKWMLVHFDCTAFWVRDKCKLQQTFSVDPVYLRHDNSGAATDFMHWQIPLSRRFRSLKLWFVLRSFGLRNLQAHIRHGIDMGKLFESLVRSDPNFEIPAARHLGLVVFCLKDGNAKTQELLRRLTKSGTMFLIPAAIHTNLIIRFTVTSQNTTKEDILRDWAIIRQTTASILGSEPVVTRPIGNTAARAEVDWKPGNENEIAGVTPGLSEIIWHPEKGQGGELPVCTARLQCTEHLIDQRLVRQGQRRAVRSLSCSGELPPTSKEGPPKSPGPGLSKIPEQANDVLGKKVLRRLTKFYSVPSFSQIWVQCGMQQVHCPFRRPWFTSSRASCFNCFTMTQGNPYALSTK